MARTRRQVTLQEQESGVPASPPQSLPNAVRPTRAKRTVARNNNDDNHNQNTAAPTDPPPATRGGPAVRGGRIGRAKRLGRSRQQQSATTSHDAPDPSATTHDAPDSSATDVDGVEASDNVTQPDAAAQAAPGARNVTNDHDKMEGRKETTVEPSGETKSPTDIIAHPVQVQDVAAHPVHGPTTPQERSESATSLKFKEILNMSPQSPSPIPGHLSPKAPTPTLPKIPTSEPSVEARTPPDVSLLSSSPLVKPIPQAPSPASQTPVYNVPSDPEHSHSLITIRMDYFQGSKDPVRPSNPASFAIPSELVAPFCRYIETRADKNSDLSKLTTDHPAVNAIVHGSARYRPQLPSWQSEQSPPLPRSTMRDAFIRKAQRKRGFREMEGENATLKAENAKLKAIAAGELIESPPKRTKIVPDPWNADGQLMLGRTKEIEVDEAGIPLDPAEVPSLRWHDLEARKRARHEEARRNATIGESPYIAEEISETEGTALGGLFAESQEQAQPGEAPETPRTRRWGLSSFLPSARSVTKFLPFSSRRTPATPQHDSSQPEQVAQTEPQITANRSQIQREPEHPDAVSGPGHRHRPSTSNQQRLLTKQQSEEEKRIKKMRAKLKREAEAIDKQRKDLEIAKKDLAEQQKSADVAQTPGQKRKRMPSPDVIPLPPGGGFGLVDEYFIVDSSSDEDVAVQETPTKERPLKKPRTSVPDDSSLGSQYRARPYTGTLFAHPHEQRSPQRDNVFAESNRPDANSALDSTPPPGPTLTFKVPSPGSSDSDEDEDDEQEQINGTIHKASTPTSLVPKSILRNSVSNQSQARPAANSMSSSKPMVPPPRPNPGHATLPPATTIVPSGALEKAREKALRHQPKQPSTLRESSRLSTSTVNSDPGDERNIEEYDPKNPAIILSPSRATVFGQHATPTTPTFGQPVSSPTDPPVSQAPVIEAVAEQPLEQLYEQPQTQLQELPREQHAVANPSREDAEKIDNISIHPDDVSSSGQAAIPAEEQEKALNDAKNIATESNLKIKGDLDRWWKEHGDDHELDEGYEDFEKDMLAEEQVLMGIPSRDPYIQPRNIISAALNRVGADSLSDRGIQMTIEDNWRPGDLERTESDPENGMRVFFDRLVENGNIEKGLADKVVAMGVPAGITKYLAGQDVNGSIVA